MLLIVIIQPLQQAVLLDIAQLMEYVQLVLEHLHQLVTEQLSLHV